MTDGDAVGRTRDGPVKFTLAADDGDGARARCSPQYRVDGGPWQTYSAKDEQIFDGTEASLAQWRRRRTAAST